MRLINKSLFFTLTMLASSASYAVCDVSYDFMASDRCSDIRNTKHNFAADDLVEVPGGVAGQEGRNVKAQTNNEVCVYCHTPHGDPNKVGGTNHFLWNRAFPVASSYTNYDSSSLNAKDFNLGQGSRMCLSCHDGTVAIGQVDVAIDHTLEPPRVVTSHEIAMSGDNLTSDGKLAGDDSSGYTANLGTDLSNDHPLGFVYNTAKATEDGELQDPAGSSHIGIRVGGGVANYNQTVTGTPSGNQPTTTSTRVSLPLESIAEARVPDQFTSVATEGTVECTTCHDPHIRSTDTSENIKFLRLHRTQKQKPTPLATGVAETGFSIDQDINCVACHKKTGWSSSVHAQSNNLYDDSLDEVKQREFPSGTSVWQASCLNCHDPHTETGAGWLLRSGADGSNNSAIEQTCFECHGNTSVVLDDGGQLPANIEGVSLISDGHKSDDHLVPNASDDQAHNPLSADLDESSTNLRTNRHVTCSDCHNPHRILRNSAHDGSGTETTATALHPHGDGINHTNTLSGALNGVSGVRVDTAGVPFDPYSTISIASYTELKGIIDQGGGNAIDVVTKEYQVCLKCHSDYGDQTIGATKPNVAIEFSEAAVSAHPVVRSSNNNANANKADVTKVSSATLDGAFQNLGDQTMYCSDCHTNDAVGGPQGPHGSSVANILAADGEDLCVTCHKTDQYKTYNAAAAVENSGFSCQAPSTDCTTDPVAPDSQNNNLHILHAQKAGASGNVCANCHVKVPHGWRNKALLADTNEADLEGLKARYYPDAIIDINDAGIPDSGAWVKADCSSSCH